MQLKRKLALGGLLILFGGSAWLALQRGGGGLQKIAPRMPALPYRTAAGPAVLRPEGGSTVIALFHSDCGHCHAELDLLDRAADRMAPARWVFLTIESSLPDALIRSRWPRLAAAAHVEWGTVAAERLRSEFGALHTPSFYVYDSGGALAAVFRGAVKPELLFRSIES